MLELEEKKKRGTSSTGSDVSTIEKGSLLLKRRVITQGPATIEMNVTPSKVRGTTTMNGQSKPIDVDPGGALFADGAGAFDVIAALPLANGYSLSFRTSTCRNRSRRSNS